MQLLLQYEYAYCMIDVCETKLSYCVVGGQDDIQKNVTKILLMYQF